MPPSINCSVCSKHRASKICKRCPAGHTKLCEHCCAAVHGKQPGHAPKALCADCFDAPGVAACETCTSVICAVCFAGHIKVCHEEEGDEQSSDCGGDENAGTCDESHSEADASVSDAESEEEAPKAKRARTSAADGKAAPGPALKEQQQQPKPAKPRKPRKSRAAGPKKIAEVIPPEGGDPVAEGAPASGDGGGGAAGVSEAVLGRIRKALALGLHQGGNALEKQHAMQRATRLMQQHGVSQADIKRGDKDGSCAAVVQVRLNGLFRRWPLWGQTLLHVATNMCNARSYFTYGRKPEPFKVSFYGLHADALMAAHIFEEAYNIVVHNGEREYGGKGKPQSIIDYRTGLSHGLYKLAKADREARDAKLREARERAQHAAAAGGGAGSKKRGSGGAKKGAGAVVAAGGRGEAWDYGADDDGGDWEAAWTKDYAGASGVEVKPQQLIVYEDKAKIAMDEHEAGKKIKKGKKRKSRKLNDAGAYRHGERDAAKVALGSKKLKAAAA